MNQKQGKMYVEMDKRVAIEVMKWKPHYDDGDLISFMTNDDKLLFFCDDPDERDWKPTLDLMQAHKVIEYLRENDIFLDIRCDIDGYWIHSYKDGTEREWHKRVSLYDLAHHICFIALETVNPTHQDETFVISMVVNK